MAEARQEGVRIACDVYPYTAGSTQLVHVLPPETQQGGMEALTEHLADPAFRETLKARMLTGSDFENISLLAGFENIVVSSVRLDGLRQYEGQSIAQIAEQQGKDPFTCLFDLLQAAHCDVTMIDFIAAEDDICDILRDAHSCVISDSTYPTTGMLHPRVYGTYTTLLEHFVREKQVLSLEAAVHKVTGRPAAVMGLRTKGVLAQGMDADINIFDPAHPHPRDLSGPRAVLRRPRHCLRERPTRDPARRADRPQRRHGPDPVNAPADMPGGRNFRAAGGPVSGFGKL